MNKSKIWTKDFVIILFANFFIACSLYLLLVVISAYAMEQFNSTPGKAGLAASIFIIGGLVARFLTGKWIETIGRKKTLYIGLVITVLMTLLYSRVGFINNLLLIRFFHGVGWGISTLATGTIAAGVLPEKRCGEGIAYFTLGSTLATAIGPFLAVFMIQNWGYNGIFLFCVIGSILTLSITLFLNIEETILTKDQMKDMAGFKLNNFLEVKVIPISIICMLVYFCYSGVLVFFTAYAKEIGLINVAGIFFIVYAMAAFVSRPFIGRAFDSRGEKAIIYPALLVFTAGMLALSQVNDIYILLLAAGFLGIGFGAIQSSGPAISVRLTQPSRIGLAYSTLYIFLDIGSGIGPFIFGLLIPFVGYRGMYLCAAAIAGICIFLYYIMKRVSCCLQGNETIVYTASDG